MSTYKNLIGKDVNFLSTDPDNEQAEGQIWYNSTSNVFKNLIVGEAWSSGGNLIVGRRYFAGCGTQTAGLAFGGNHTGSDTDNNTEEYNGSGWANGGNLTTGRAYLAGCGTQTAGLAFGGGTHPSPATQAITEEYNGSSWSEQNDMSTARRALAGAGTQTSALAFGGSVPPTLQTATEEYGGTSWTSGGAMSTARKYLAGAGASQTVALAFGGMAPGATNATEEYDGSSWTTGGNLNTSRGYLAGAGTQTAALAMAGYNDKTNTEEYDGTSWSNKPAMATGREGVAGCGITTAGLVFGGKVNDVVSNTEEFTSSINVITGGAWASGGNMGTARYTAGDCGVYNAGLVFGGNPSSAPYTNNSTEEYGGTSWTAGGNIPHASSDVSGAGTQTAALAFGFGDSPTATTATYDGSSWTTVPGTVPGATSQGRGIGTQTAAIHVGFASPGTTSLEYDGSSWTAGGTLNNKRSGQKPGGWGIQTAAVLASGYQTPPATIISNTETYNGTAWTETGHSVVAARKRTSVTTAGPNSNGMLMGGGDNAGTNDSSTTVQLYNGTTWVTQANLATARINSAGFGTSTNAVVAGGGPPVTAATEEFTGETSALNIKTITTS